MADTESKLKEKKREGANLDMEEGGDMKKQRMDEVVGSEAENPTQVDAGLHGQLREYK